MCLEMTYRLIVELVLEGINFLTPCSLPNFRQKSILLNLDCCVFVCLFVFPVRIK